MWAGSKKRSPTPRLQAEGPADSGTEWEKRSGGGGWGWRSLVDADWGRIQIARGGSGACWPPGVTKPLAMRLGYAGREGSAIPGPKALQKTKRAEVCGPVRGGSRTRGERIGENRGRRGIPFSMVLSLSWLHPPGEQSDEPCALPEKSVTHVSTTVCIGSIPVTSQDPETRLSGGVNSRKCQLIGSQAQPIIHTFPVPRDPRPGHVLPVAAQDRAEAENPICPWCPSHRARTPVNQCGCGMKPVS